MLLCLYLSNAHARCGGAMTIWGCLTVRSFPGFGFLHRGSAGLCFLHGKQRLVKSMNTYGHDWDVDMEVNIQYVIHFWMLR